MANFPLSAESELKVTDGVNSDLFHGSRAVFVNRHVTPWYFEFCERKWIQHGGEVHADVHLDTMHIFATDFATVLELKACCPSCPRRFLATTCLLHWDWIVASLKVNEQAHGHDLYRLHPESSAERSSSWHNHFIEMKRKQKKRKQKKRKMTELCESPLDLEREKVTDLRESPLDLEREVDEILVDRTFSAYIGKLFHPIGPK
ncbi:unnamed protein product [Calypogeia fissa]